MATYDEPHFNPEPPQRSWLSRNALWFIPGGLLFLCLCPVLCCGGFIFSLVRGFGESEPAAMAFDLVRGSPEVTDRLGEPLEKSSWATGSISINNGGGAADLHFSVSGPQGSAQVHTEAARFGGVWDLQSVEITFEDGTSIDLYDPPPPDGIPGDAPTGDPAQDGAADGDSDAEIEAGDTPAEL